MIDNFVNKALEIAHNHVSLSLQQEEFKELIEEICTYQKEQIYAQIREQRKVDDDYESRYPRL